MSEVAIPRADAEKSADSVFSPLTIVLMLVIGILGFAGSLLLGAYAPDLRSGRNAGAHALSNAATGYAGIVELARATGRNPHIVRSEAGWDDEDLVVVTPESGGVDLGKFLKARRGRPTLIVLPKWLTVADRKASGWVNVIGLLPAFDPARMLAPATPLTITRHPSGGRPLHPAGPAPASLAPSAPQPLQVMTSPIILPVLTDDNGGIVLGWLNGSSVYVLADPDLLNNQGIRRLDRARAALDLLDYVNANGANGIGFDVTLNGLGRSRSPLKLLFEPPFLAMTLAIVVALALVGWQALVRFGPARPPERVIAFGKAALIDNSAMIVRKAGREGGLGARYAALIRERARAMFGVPAHLTDDAADRYLDRLHGAETFTALAAEAERARHPADMLAGAQALHQWQQEKTR